MTDSGNSRRGRGSDGREHPGESRTEAGDVHDTGRHRPTNDDSRLEYLRHPDHPDRGGHAHPERFIGTHYLNPPHLMPPVEVIPGEATDPEHRHPRTRTTSWRWANHPSWSVWKSPGFLWNRLQYAILREACHIVEQGIATMEEVDMVMRQGLARRWSIVGGPFASLDLGGIGTSALVGEYLFPALSSTIRRAADARQPCRCRSHRRGKRRRFL